MDIYSGCKLEDIMEYWKKLFPEMEDTKTMVEYLREAVGLNIENETMSFFDGSVTDQLQKEMQSVRQSIENNIRDARGVFSITKLHFWVEPIVDEAMSSLFGWLCEINEIKDKQAFFEKHRMHLVQSLSGIMMRTFVFELNYRKEQGESGEEALSTFYSEYEVLYSLLYKEAHNYVNYIKEIIVNTHNYKKIIENSLFEEEIGPMIDIDMDLGDRHCNGKTVAVLIFERHRVIYKPRNMQIDISFQQLLDWMNAKFQFRSPLKTMKIVDGSSCGWCEYIDYRECEGSRLNEFYYKLGSYLCIMYVLNATDMHYENVIANQENPMFIDLESLFSIQENHEKDPKENGAASEIIKKIRASVDSIGLLPHKIKSKYGEIEIGGIGSKKKQIAPVRSLKLVQDEEDAIHLEYTNAIIEGKKNAPRESEELDIQEFVTDITKGFSETYEKVLLHKEELLTQIEYLFSKACVRVILKPTVGYADLLKMSLHPDFLGDSISRCVLLSRIGLFHNRQERDTRILHSEIKQLFNNQVPYYYSYFRSKEIFDGCTNQVVSCREKTAQQALEDKFSMLCKEDLVQQCSILESTFYKRNLEAYKVTIQKYCKNGESYRANKQEVLEVSQKIADYVLLRSCTGDSKNLKDRRYWGSSLLLIEDDNWRCTIDSLDLYDGNAGIALMLLKLWEKTKEKVYLEYLKQTVEPIIELILNYADTIENPGFFKGLGGYIYLFAILKRSYDDTRNVQIMDKLLSLAEQYQQTEKPMDFVIGNIGLVAGLLYDWKYEQNIEIKNRIIKIAEKQCEFIDQKEKLKLSGFAHGFNGALPFIYQLYQITSKDKYLAFVKEILEIERTSFWLPEENDWRISMKEENYAYGWCHGSPGILLGKTLLYRMGYKDAQIEHEMQIAAENVIKKGLGNNLCICHGDLGNISILRYYADLIENQSLCDYCEDRINQLFHHFIKHKWNDYELETNKFNGLMIGLAGVVVALQSELKEWL